VKILYITCQNFDYVAGTLWSGLIELLGADNVIDYPNIDYMRGKNTPIFTKVNQYPTAYSKSNILSMINNNEISHIIINYCYFWFFKWDDIECFFNKFNGEIIYINGSDEAALPNLPPIRIHKIFQREIIKENEKKIAVPLFMSANKYMLNEEFISFDKRPIDIFFSGNLSNQLRWDVGKILFNMHKQFKIVYATDTFLDRDRYYEISRKSKLNFHIRGAGWDCMRLWELLSNYNCVIADKPDIELEDQFFRHGESMIFFDKNNLKDIVYYYLDHLKEMENVALNSFDLLKRHHLNINRAKKILN